MKTPLFLFAVTYILSLICSLFYDGGVVLCAVLTALGVAVFFVLHWQKLPWFLCFLGVVFALGFSYGEIREAQTPEDPFTAAASCTVTGRILNDPAVTATTCKFQLRAASLNGKPLEEPVKIIVLTEKESEVAYGDDVTVVGAFLTTEVLNPGGFDYGAYLAERDLYGTLSALYGGEVTVDSSGHGNFFMKAAYFLKHRFEAALSYLPTEQQALIKGIFFGDTSGVDYDTAEVLTKSGIRHCFAVSGLHVGYVILFLAALCTVLGLGRKARIVLCLPCLLLYAAITGFSPSVLRATVMCLMVFGAELLGREKNSYNGLGAAALLLLVWNPGTLLLAGFQLSFIAMFSIVFFMPWLERLIPWDFPGKGAILVTVASQIGMMPVLAYLFHVVSLVSFLVSTLCCLLVGMIVLLCFMALFFSLLSPFFGAMLLIPAGLLAQLILDAVSLGVQLPFAYLYKGDFAVFWLLLVYGVIAVAVLLPALRRRRLLSAGIVTTALVLLLLPPLCHADELELTFLSVGEGDAAYIHTPAGEDLLIDVGDAKNGSVSYYTIRPFLLSKGVDGIDRLFFSHSDVDHSGGAAYIADYFDVSSYIIAAAGAKTYDPALFAGAADVTYAESGDVIDLGDGVKITTLYPDGGIEAEDNDLSLVLRLTYGDFSALFTGDIAAAGIGALLEENAELAADVIKIPHHGSKHSYDEEFYRRVAPEAAVISVGKNSYGHPAKEVVSYFKKHYIDVYRTDTDGAVTFTSDGSGFDVVTFAGTR